MRSLALVALMSQFGVNRCAPTPAPTPNEPVVENPVSDAPSETALERSIDYGDAGDYLFDEVADQRIELATGRSVEVTLYEPRRSGPAPLVVVSPGFQLNRDFYSSYAEHLASWGFVVATQTYSGRVSGLFNSNHASLAEDTIALVDALAAEPSLSVQVDRDAVALVGHSLGGKISILAGVLDPSIAAVVGLDPVDANTPSVTPELIPSIAAPLMLLGETLDSRGLFQACAPAENNFEQYFADAPEGTILLDILGAGHMQFHDEPRCLVCRACNGSTSAAADDVLAMSRDAMTPFLLAKLQGFTGWDAYVAEGVLTERWTESQVVQAIR